jgi:hypothetical protein
MLGAGKIRDVDANLEVIDRNFCRGDQRDVVVFAWKLRGDKEFSAKHVRGLLPGVGHHQDAQAAVDFPVWVQPPGYVCKINGVGRRFSCPVSADNHPEWAITAEVEVLDRTRGEVQQCVLRLEFLEQFLLRGQDHLR